MSAIAMNHPIEQSQPQAMDRKWSDLYKAGAVAALLSAAFLPIQILVFIVEPPPSTVNGWFELFQANRLIGLLDIDLLLIVDQILAILIFLALYVALREANESLMAISLGFSLTSVVLFIASNPAFAMLSLSEQYAAAETEAQKAMLLAAGQTLTAMWQGSAFHVSYVLGSFAPILMCLVMLRGRLFTKAIAYLGILANVIALGLYVPTIGVYISVFSVVFLWIWYILVARRLFQLGKMA